MITPTMAHLNKCGEKISMLCAYDRSVQIVANIPRWQCSYPESTGHCDIDIVLKTTGSESSDLQK